MNMDLLQTGLLWSSNGAFGRLLDQNFSTLVHFLIIKCVGVSAQDVILFESQL